ncbi:N-acetylglucosamine kinase [Thermoactinospora rubra]|uniref:N-acetylglucosamine kinase n=1 Tax=Thermoactinospora rubra TaxID=1088767 RepID=UPI001981408A|nr:BadF/BadG/BcrA/BcrD ATPase family protein [Thermoactinospora rubra]
MRTVLAVDGGNSKTDLALVAEDGTVLGERRTGPFVPHSVGARAAADVVEEAARALLGGATAPYAEVMAAFLAGADFPEEEDALRAELLARGCAKEVAVANDAFAVLRAGASRPWGVAVVCGAGMNAVGVSPAGRTARFPALGRISGDWGGGEDLAEEVLWHAVRAEEGRGPATGLLPLVVSHFGVGSVTDLVVGLHFGEVARARLHELVPGLFAVAAEGDPVARSLVERQAREVVAMAEVCLRRLDLLDSDAEVVLGGSVLTARDPLLHGMVESAIGAVAPRATLVVTALPPIAGAVLHGLDLLGAPPAALARARAHWRR